jgi:hypothetical protein
MYPNNDSDYMMPAVPPLYPTEPIYNEPMISESHIEYTHMNPYMCPMMDPRIRQCVEICMRQCYSYEYMYPIEQNIPYEMEELHEPICQEEALGYEPPICIEEE